MILFRELSDICCRIAKERDSGVDFCFAKRICMQKSMSYWSRVASNVIINR